MTHLLTLTEKKSVLTSLQWLPISLGIKSKVLAMNHNVLEVCSLNCLSVFNILFTVVQLCCPPCHAHSYPTFFQVLFFFFSYPHDSGSNFIEVSVQMSFHCICSPWSLNIQKLYSPLTELTVSSQLYTQALCGRS